jgi:hypothetical protein
LVLLQNHPGALHTISKTDLTLFPPSVEQAYMSIAQLVGILGVKPAEAKHRNLCNKSKVRIFQPRDIILIDQKSALVARKRDEEGFAAQPPV